MLFRARIAEYKKANVPIYSLDESDHTLDMSRIHSYSKCGVDVLVGAKDILAPQSDNLLIMLFFY